MILGRELMIQGRQEKQDEQVWIFIWTSGISGIRQQWGRRRVPEQPVCFRRVAAPQAGTDGERVTEALRHMLRYICGSGSLLSQTTSLPRTGGCKIYSRHFSHCSVLREMCSQNQRRVLREQGELRRYKSSLKNAWGMLRKWKERPKKDSTVFVLK